MYKSSKSYEISLNLFQIAALFGVTTLGKNKQKTQEKNYKRLQNCKL